jgi:hypothetical protein
MQRKRPARLEKPEGILDFPDEIGGAGSLAGSAEKE